MKRLLLALLLVAGCGAAAPTPQIIYVTPPPGALPTPIIVNITPEPPPSGTVHSLTGTFTLVRGDGVSSNFGGNGSSCHGTGGYSDFQDGMTVVVKDQAGTIVATGATDTAAVSAGNCVMRFSIPSIPDATFYSVEIGHRGAVTYSRADMETRGWKLDLTLGS